MSDPPLTRDLKTDLKHLINHLHRGGAWAHLWTDYKLQSHWFRVDEPESRTIPKGWLEHNVYFTVNPLSEIPPKNASGNTKRENIGSQYDYVCAINCLYAEYDGKDYVQPDEYADHLPPGFEGLSATEQKIAVKAAKETTFYADPGTFNRRAMDVIESLEYPPSVCVHSGGGYHCYWLLQETIPLDEGNRDDVQGTQYGWVQMVKADPGVSDLRRILRLPGTRNQKDGFGNNAPLVAFVWANFDDLYDYTELEETVNDWLFANRPKAEDRPQPQKKSDAPSDNVRERFNELSSHDELLTRHGYVLCHENDTFSRYARAGRDKHEPSITVWPADPENETPELSIHFSSNDPLYSEEYRDPETGRGKRRAHDAYYLFVHLEHDGDWKSAFIAAKKQLGLWKESPEMNPVSIGDVYMNGDTPHTNGNGAIPPEPQSILLAQSADDEGNAQCVYALHGQRFLFCNAFGWMENVGSHWETSGESEARLNRTITETLIQRRIEAVRNGEQYEAIVKATKPTAKNKRETKSQFSDIVTVDASTFDKEPDVLNCKNGVINLKTGKLVAHESSNRFTYCLPIEYDPEAGRSDWVRFLGQVIKDFGQNSETAKWLQMALGYSITGRTSEECMFYIFGPTRSGKGTFTNAMLNLLRYPLAQGVDFSTFTKKRDGDSQNFDLAPMRAARFISASESSKYQSLNEAAVKAITGNDPIMASYKYKTPFSYIPQFKIWLSSNHPVRGDVDDDAFWGRVRVIEFPNSFLGGEDKNLKQHMATPEVLQGVLAWLVEGASLWYASKDGLKTPQTVAESTKRQRDEQDHIGQWLNECCKVKADNFVTNRALRHSYENWCESQGYKPWAAAAFGRAITKRGFESASKKVAGSTQRGFMGLILRPEDPTEDDGVTDNFYL